MITIIYERIPSGSPAKIYPARRIIVIDPVTFYEVPSFNMRVFILAHELAHLTYHKEEDADLAAFKAYYCLGYPVRDAIFALTGLLNPTDAHRRVVALINDLYEKRN